MQPNPTAILAGKVALVTGASSGIGRAIALSGVFHCMKYQIPAMLKSGGGSIVNVASILGAVAFAGAPAYTAAKHGVLGLTKAAAVEYSAQGVRGSPAASFATGAYYPIDGGFLAR